MFRALWRWLHGPAGALQEAPGGASDERPFNIYQVPTWTLPEAIAYWEGLADHYEAAAVLGREPNARFYQARADAAHQVSAAIRAFHQLGDTPEWFALFRPWEP